MVYSMKFGFLRLYPPTLTLAMLMAGPALAQTNGQILTPGAAAIGGTTTTEPLIAPTGTQTPQPGEVLNPVAESEARTVHLPDPDWPITLPPARGARGGTAGTTTSAGAVTPTQPVVQQPTPPAATPTPSQPEAAEPTTQVTAGAGSAETPETQPTAPVTSLNPLDSFEQAALNFGADGVELPAQHELDLDPVVALMQANPGTPLRVVAVLPLAQSSDDDARLLARRRILAVRRYILELGLDAESLSFSISANTTLEPFANHVLVQR